MIRDLVNKEDNSSGKQSYVDWNDFDLPIKTMEEMKALEQKLNDEKTFSDLVSKIKMNW